MGKSASGKGLDALFSPRSVAVIGASDDMTRISGRTMRYLLESGYAGTVFPVNPKRETVQSVRAYASIADLPVCPDLAIVAVPATAACQAVRECVARGVPAAILFTSGFAEVNADGQRVQEEIAAIARHGGLRLLGPNCVGVFNSTLRFYGTFTQSLDREFPRDGPVAVVSQSGAFAGHLLYLAKQRNLGIRYWCSTGNEADIDLAEIVLWLAQQPEVRVIIAYAEGIRNGEALIDAFRIAHDKGKAIVMLKVGRSEAGAQAASSHTAALAGSDAVYDAVFRQYGVYRARTTEECVDIAYACAKGLYPADRTLGIFTVSGGAGVQMADAAAHYGLDVVAMPQSTQNELKALLPYAAVGNPVDVTAQIQNDMSLVTRFFEVMLKEGKYGTIVGFLTSLPNSRVFGPRLREAIEQGTRNHRDRLVVLSLLADPDVVRSYEDAGFLVFEDADRAVQASAALASIGCALVRNVPSRMVAQERRITLDGPQTEVSAKEILSAQGITVLPERLVHTPAEAVVASEQIGYPVVLKIVSPDILHKTEIGGVLLNLADAEAVSTGAERMLRNAARQVPHATIEGILVAPMAPKGIETIIGTQRDPVFGPMVMFGFGGILVDVFKDVTFRHAPFDEAEALNMIREVKAYALLEGVRGVGRADIGCLCRTLASLSQFAAANEETIDSIDINPFLVLPDGSGGVALDAVIVPHSQVPDQDGQT